MISATQAGFGDTGEESPPSSPHQSQRRGFTGSQWTGGENRLLHQLSGAAAEGFTRGWDNLGLTCFGETGDTQHHPIAGSRSSLPRGREPLIPHSEHLGPPLGQAYHTGYDVPDPSSLAQNPQGFSSLTSGADYQAGFTENNHSVPHPIAGLSGGGENSMIPPYLRI